MNLFFSPYLLQKKSRLNAKDSSESQPGLLLKVVQGDDWGVADLCPHPEVGDKSAAQELADKGLLFLRSVELAIEDLLARKNGVSLLQNKPIKNNYLVSDYHQTNLNQSLYAGCTVKIKGDTNITELAEKLNRVECDLRLRLDFNSCLSNEMFEEFLSLLNNSTHAKIEYIEDPTVLSDRWKNWNLQVPLAFDFQSAAYNEELARFRIIKPARQRVPDLKNFTLTSSMDHPVGVAHGLRIAQQMANNDSGFLTLDLYERTAFNGYFEQNLNELNFSNVALNDVGIGMTATLQKMAWTAL